MSLIIKQVSNGFVVRPDGGHNDFVADKEVHVFQSFAEMVNHLAEVFDHRATTIEVDQPAKEEKRRGR